MDKIPKMPKLPGGGVPIALINLGVVAGLGIYGISNSLYNVEGGHRAIIFNRLVGIKEKVHLLFLLEFIVMLIYFCSFP